MCSECAGGRTEGAGSQSNINSWWAFHSIFNGDSYPNYWHKKINKTWPSELLVRCYPHIKYLSPKSGYKFLSPLAQAHNFSLVSTEGHPEFIWNVTQNPKGRTAPLPFTPLHSPTSWHYFLNIFLAFFFRIFFHLPKNLSSLRRSQSVKRHLINGQHVRLKRLTPKVTVTPTAAMFTGSPDEAMLGLAFTHSSIIFSSLKSKLLWGLKYVCYVFIRL